MVELNRGDALAGYRIEARIREGSTGVVYTALDTSLDRRVALKVLRPELARDARFRERFLRESRVAASLEHPNIVPIHAVGEEGEVLFIAMRYVDGRDLGELLAQVGRLEPKRALHLLGQVASALDAAHARQLVHRDVKPGNILIARYGDREQAYLCDFGLAKHASTVTSLTGDRAVVGTVDYLAPELIEGRPIDGRIDVYGLGCVLYQCLTGMPPYPRENELASIMAHLQEPVPRLSERRRELPEALDDVIATALAKDRDERYATCGELVRAASAALAGEPTAAPVATERAAPALQTFLFCDIRGYTAYTRDHGDEAGAALAATFAALVGELAPAFDGRLQELRGDEALLVFESARQALRFALEFQSRVAADGLERGVGVGIDAGEAVAVAGGFRGGALNRAARLCSLAGPGEVLASDAVLHVAGKIDGVAYGRRREERLKGFDEPVGVVTVHHPGADPDRPARAGRRSGRRAALIAGAVIAAATAALLVSTRSEGGGKRADASITAATATPAKAITAYDPATGEPTGSVAGQTAWAFVTGPNELYALDPNRHYLAVIDSATAALREQIPVERPHRFLPTVEFGSIWFTKEDGDAVVRIDPVYRRAVAEIKLPHRGLDDHNGVPPGGVARVGEEIWVTYGYPARLARIDPTDNHVIRTTRLPDGSPVTTNVVSDGSEGWVVYDDGSVIARLAATGQVEATGKAAAGGNIVDAAAAEGYLWLTMDSIDGVWKVGRDATPVEQIATGKRTWQLTPGNGFLWISNAGSGTVTRLDPRTGATRQTNTQHRPLGVAVTGGRLWVGLDYSAADARARITGKHVVTASVAQVEVVIDPASYSDAPSLAVGYAVGASLMRYQPAADGTAGLLPDVAAADPLVSDGGRRYAFQIRSDMRFSPPSGAKVTAEDVRFSLERMIAEGGLCAVLASDIVGSQKFTDGKAAHVSGISLDGNTLSVMLAAPSATLPARLASPCTQVVPTGTPPAEGGLTEPISSAGPYYIDTHTFGEQIVLLRNPSYRGPRAGKLDGIVLTAAGDAERGAALVESGKADIAADLGQPASPAFAPGGRLEQTYGAGFRCPAGTAEARCFVRPPFSGLRLLQLDTRSAALADADTRRAIEVAIDREALAVGQHGSPASRLIGPGIPGYDPAARLPPKGDLAAARSLMHGRKATIVLAVARYNAPLLQVGADLRRQLAPIGVRVDVRQYDDPYSEAFQPGTPVNAILDGWAPDYPDAEASIYPVVSPRAFGYNFPHWFDDPTLLDDIDTARAVVGPGRAAAWAAVDADVVAAAAFIPLYTLPSYPQLFSPRIGCQAFLPLYRGLVDLSALCLR